MQRFRWALCAAGASVGAAVLAPGSAGATQEGSTAAVPAAVVTGAAGTVPLTSVESRPAADRAPLTVVADDAPAIAAGNPVTAPLKWTGEYITGTGDDHSIACTAQFITPRVILLAAHCVRNHLSGDFYPIDKAVFLLQYQNHNFSKAYHVVCRATWNAWPAPLRPGEDLAHPETMTTERRDEYTALFAHSWQWDYAFVLLDGESITGHYNYSINTHWDGGVSTGYPDKLMGGEVIQALPGDVFPIADVAWSQGDEQNEQVLWHGNPDHTQGASGGAWVANYNSKVSDDTNIIIGLNSYGVGNKPGANFGPFFTDKFVTLLNYVQAGCK